MTDEMMNLCALVEKGPSVISHDLLRPVAAASRSSSLSISASILAAMVLGFAIGTSLAVNNVYIKTTR